MKKLIMTFLIVVGNLTFVGLEAATIINDTGYSLTISPASIAIGSSAEVQDGVALTVNGFVNILQPSSCSIPAESVRGRIRVFKNFRMSGWRQIFFLDWQHLPA